MKRNPEEIKDIEICKDKINAILEEYNCCIELVHILSIANDYYRVWLRDKDTDETLGLK